MKAKYDTEEIALTSRFIEALRELMAAECEMMQQNEPESAECWTWGRCHVLDLATHPGFEFEFGGDEDYPDDGLARFAVVVREN